MMAHAWVTAVHTFLQIIQIYSATPSMAHSAIAGAPHFLEQVDSYHVGMAMAQCSTGSWELGETWEPKQ